MSVARSALHGSIAIAMLATPGLVRAQDGPPSQRDSTALVRAQSNQTDSSRVSRPSALTLVTSETVDQLRSAQLRKGVERGHSLLLRSASSLTPSTAPTASAWRRATLAPQFLFVVNSAIPFSQNYGSLWAGTGISTRTLLGFKLESSRTRIMFAPEIVLSTNSNWLLRHDFYAPALPPDRSQYDFPFYVGRFTIDQPMRFGDRPIGRIDLGQTTAMWSGNRLALGFSNESEWWGPGIRNAIVLSNNAPGFPHFFVRTARPLATRLGGIEIRWLVGGLKESPYFDTVSTNNTRSMAAIAATLQTRWDPNLSVGFARSVYGTATGWGQVPWRWFDVFARTHIDVPDTSRTQRDQLFTLFARWVFPADGIEVYGEWGRLELQPSLRAFLVSPNHTQGYTLGLQWRAPEWRNGTFRLQTEVTQLEQSATFRDRLSGSWYTSPRVIQGYTHRGQPLGASIGPGASSQWLALDYLKPAWRLGAFAGRIRWNEDVHSNFGFPEYVSYCNHDVSIYPGIRGAKTGRLGTISAELSLQNRLNAFFQNGGGCPNNGPRLDIRNNTFSVTFTP
jgi:hypothetical protein